MPPFYPQPPFDTLAQGPRWLDVALTVVAVACEPWALALIALALYSWLEREVPAVLKAAAPLAVALAAGGGLTGLAHLAWAAPRLAGAGDAVGSLLHRLLPGAQVVGLGVFVGYSLLAYGRRVGPAVTALAALGGVARVWAGPHALADLARGGAAGALLGALAYLAAVRLAPGGHLARLRATRRTGSASPEAGAEPPVP